MALEFHPTIGKEMSPGINFGVPGGVPPVLGGGPPTPGVMGDPTAESALSAMGALLPKDNTNPTESMAKVGEALGLAHQLVLRALPQVTSWSPKLAQTLHAVAKQLLSATNELQQEAQSFMPPPMMGMGDVTGLPGGMPMGGMPPGMPGGMGGGGF